MTAKEESIRSALRYPAFRSLLTGLARLPDRRLALQPGLGHAGLPAHDGALASVATAARVIPMVVFGPPGGAIADRFDRRRVMVTCDLIRLALMLALALAAAARLPIVIVPVLAALATAAGAPYLPATRPPPRAWCATPTCPARTPPGPPSPPSASSPARRSAACCCCCSARRPWRSPSTR